MVYTVWVVLFHKTMTQIKRKAVSHPTWSTWKLLVDSINPTTYNVLVIHSSCFFLSHSKNCHEHTLPTVAKLWPSNYVQTRKLSNYIFSHTQPCKNKNVQNNDALMHLSGHLEHKIQWKEMADVDSFSTPDAKKKIKKLTNLCSAKW
jgi:hypothetical protein